MPGVLIVDDEQIIRITLSSIVNWAELGFDAIYTAANGKAGLEHVREDQDIELIITDINMPVMDGLALITGVNKLERDIYFIILSAYDDFELVRTAFKLGAGDYIRKAELDEQSVRKVVLSCRNKKKEPVRKADLKEEIHRQQLLDLLYGVAGEHTVEKVLSLQKGKLILCTLIVDDYQKVIQKYPEHEKEKLQKIIEETIFQVLQPPGRAEAVSVSGSKYVLFLSIDELSDTKIRDRVTQLLGKVKTALYNYVNVGITAGVSETGKEIKKLFSQSNFAAEMRSLNGKGSIIFFTDQKEFSRLTADGEISKIYHNIVHAVFVCDRRAVKEQLEALDRNLIQNQSPNISDMSAKYLRILHSVLYEYTNRYGKLPVNMENRNFLHDISQFETSREIMGWLVGQMMEIMELVHTEHFSDYKAYITRVEKYIDHHFQDAITLKTAAQHVGVSESYLSSIFSKEKKITFIDYLTNRRIEHAKSLLSNDTMKIYEVANRCGYKNVEHFSRTFKKITGVSSKNYRNHELG